MSSAVIDASERFRRVRGYRELHVLIAELLRIEAEQEATITSQVA